MDSGNQDIKPKKIKVLRSKHRPRQFLPLGTVSTPAITASFIVSKTISDDAPTFAYTFNPLEVEVAEALFLLAHDVVRVSESYSMTKSKMHECTICKEKFHSGKALGGHKRKHFESVIVKMIVAGIVNSSPNPRAMMKSKYI